MPRCLIAYDIASDKARRKAANLLSREGTRLQKSVFFVTANAARLRRLERQLLDLLDAEDSLLLLPCCENCLARAGISGTEPPRALVA